MPIRLTKLFRTGILQSRVELDEITYGSIKVSNTGIYAAEFDEISLSTSTAERRTSTGTYLVSGHFDEYTIAPAIMQANGGTTNIYSANGKNYKTHTFISSSTFNVITPGIVDIVMVGGGGGGSFGYYGGPTYSSPGCGGDGGYGIATSIELEAGSYTISVGNGGRNGYNSQNRDGLAGGQTQAFGFTVYGGAGGPQSRLNTAGTTHGVLSSISGSSYQYGQGGPITYPSAYGAQGTNGTGDGGASGGLGNYWGGYGGTGVVIVRYVI
jgi:hypothetical protein